MAEARTLNNFTGLEGQPHETGVTGLVSDPCYYTAYTIVSEAILRLIGWLWMVYLS